MVIQDIGAGWEAMENSCWDHREGHYFVVQPELTARVHKLVQHANDVMHVSAPAKEEDAFDPLLGSPVRALHLDFMLTWFNWSICIVILRQDYDLVSCASKLMHHFLFR